MNTCVKFGCEQAPLVFLKAGASRQTNNGFLIAKVPGWYCPNCSAGYGGEKRGGGKGRDPARQRNRFVGRILRCCPPLKPGQTLDTSWLE